MLPGAGAFQDVQVDRRRAFDMKPAVCFEIAGVNGPDDRCVASHRFIELRYFVGTPDFYNFLIVRVSFLRSGIRFA